MIFSILMGLSLWTNAQASLDTIYANDKVTVALFFPHTICQGITGSENFVFTYNREKQQYFGLLQAQPGVDSNLLAITEDGQVYAYIIKYADSIPKLNYFISVSESIGREKPLVKHTKNVMDTIGGELEDKTTPYQSMSEQLLKISKKAISSRRKKGIVLKLLDLKYDKNKVYLVLEIKNRSEIDFEVDDLKVYVTSGHKKRKSSYQRLELPIRDQYKKPKRIRSGEHKRFVYVVPKFVLGDKEKLMIVLNELHGSRTVVLK